MEPEFKAEYKIVPNPEYATARFEEVVVRRDGKPITGIPPRRFKTLKDAQTLRNPVPTHICVPL